jgi:general stress protein YciG
MKELTQKEMASKGGKARAASLTAEQRKEIGRKGAAKRWSKPRKGVK